MQIQCQDCLTMANTEAQFDKAIQVCRDVYSKKLKDYGAAWRIMRPCSITDQIFIKANRIRTLETKGNHCVDEGIQPELIGIVNYAIDLQGVGMAYFAREVDGGRVKVSLRALEPFAVDGIAAQFGGGGHKLAAGLTLSMPMAEAVATIEKALEAAL